jgi:hypothetical protein
MQELRDSHAVSLSVGQKIVVSFLFHLLLFPSACGFFLGLNGLSHSQLCFFNMEPCTACEEKPTLHIPSGAKKRCSSKTKPNPQTVWWEF